MLARSGRSVVVGRDDGTTWAGDLADGEHFDIDGLFDAPLRLPHRTSSNQKIERVRVLDLAPCPRAAEPFDLALDGTWMELAVQTPVHPRRDWLGARCAFSHYSRRWFVIDGTPGV
jgi:hypothetical protein